MKIKCLLTLSVLFVLGSILCTNTGCKKKEAVNDAPPVTANKTEPAPAGTQTEKSIEASVKPAADANSIVEGGAFPALEFAGLGGEQISLANLKGKVVLIDFWATWCGPCRSVMPDLVETYKEYHDKGFEIIGISLDKDQSQLENYMKETGMTWRQYYDGLGWNNKVAKRFGVRAIPHVVLIDKNGIVHFNTDYKLEKPPLHGAELRNVVDQLCNAAP